MKTKQHRTEHDLNVIYRIDNKQGWLVKKVDKTFDDFMCRQCPFSVSNNNDIKSGVRCYSEEALRKSVCFRVDCSHARYRRVDEKGNVIKI